MTTNPPWVFLVLGITAGWLMAWHHLRLELSRLVFCQVDSLSLFQLYFLSPLQLFSVFRLLFAFVCAHRDMYRLGFLWSLFRSPDVGVCCWWSTEWAREKPSPEGVHGVGPDSQTQGAFFLSFRILCEVHEWCLQVYSFLKLCRLGEKEVVIWWRRRLRGGNFRS